MNEEYSLYLDMDGVLVDFDGGYKKLTSGKTFDQYADDHGNATAERKFMTKGSKFWSELEWIEGGKELYDIAKELFKTVNILSSTGAEEDDGRHDRVSKGKLEWINKNGLEFTEIAFSRKSALKYEYATPTSILVDDLSSNIREWNKADGTGILHKSSNFKKTIERLKELSTPLSLSEISRRFMR